MKSTFSKWLRCKIENSTYGKLLIKSDCASDMKILRKCFTFAWRSFVFQSDGNLFPYAGGNSSCWYHSFDLNKIVINNCVLSHVLRGSLLANVMYLSQQSTFSFIILNDKMRLLPSLLWIRRAIINSLVTRKFDNCDRCQFGLIRAEKLKKIIFKK